MKFFLLALLIFSNFAFSQSTQFGDFKVLAGNIIGTQNVLNGYATTATAAGTTTLTKTSAGKQYFTGSTTQTVLLPVASTLILGQSYTIVDNSTGIVTVQSSGGNTLQAMQPGTQLTATIILLNGTGTASWSFVYAPQAISQMTTLGDMLYEDSTPKPVRLAGNITSTKQYLSQTGTGSVSAAPAWATPACGDLSNAAASCSTDATNASNISSGTLGAAMLPAPTASTLGGIESYAATTHQWINTISTAGAPSSSQPAFTDISGTLQSTQFPALTGDVTTAGGALATTLATVNSNVGTFGSTSVVPTITVNGKGLITAVTTSSVTATSSQNVVSKTSNYTAAANDYVIASSSSFNITLPTAVGVNGQQIVVEHAGTSLTQLYTILTTSGQTVCGLSSGNVILVTVKETIVFESDNSNWRCPFHYSNSTVFSSGANWAFSATSAYTFTIPSSSITIGTVYTNNGCTFTVSATTASSTTLTTSGTCNPAASGTLTFVSGSPSGNLAFSARTITGVPALGTTTTNSVTWYRQGNLAIIKYMLVQTGAGTAGSGDYIFYLPAGLTIDTSNITPFQTVSSLLAGTQLALMPTVGFTNGSGTFITLGPGAYAYSNSSFRIGTLGESGGTLSGGNLSSSFNAFSTAVLDYNLTITVPMVTSTGVAWLP